MVEPGARRAYLEQVFVWYHERTRVSLAAIVVSAAALLGLVARLQWRPIQSLSPSILVVGAIALLGLLYLWRGRVLLSPLHREYLCCLALLPRLEKYETELAATVRRHGQREPAKHFTCWRTPGHSARQEKMLSAMAAADRRCGEKLAKAASRAQRERFIGEYLFTVLGPVPTDDYERLLIVQLTVDHYLAGCPRA